MMKHHKFTFHSDFISFNLLNVTDVVEVKNIKFKVTVLGFYFNQPI